MDPFARTIIGYHGCTRDFARALLSGKSSIQDWNFSQYTYDWLGEGIYFWEHSPNRALRWAKDNKKNQAAVVGAVIQLGKCFDLMDETITEMLAKSYVDFAESYAASGITIPTNHGIDKKLRDLDCAVINDCLDRYSQNIGFDTVRGAFLEGEPIFAGTTISAETHIQIAVRNVDCIIGTFMPNFV